MSCSGELCCGELLIGNTLDVLIVRLRTRGEYVNDANCAMTLRTKEGVEIAGAVNIPLVYTGTPGEYLGQLPASLALSASAVYKLTATATKAGVADGSWTATLLAQVRGPNC